jgi:hypothetical protein
VTAPEAVLIVGDCNMRAAEVRGSGLVTKVGWIDHIVWSVWTQIHLHVASALVKKY